MCNISFDMVGDKRKHEAVKKRNFNRFYMYISETNEWNKAV